MRQFSSLYTIGFSAAVCVVCSLLVSSAAVGLKTRQGENAFLDRQRNVLMAIGAIEPGQSVSRKEIQERFKAVEPAIVDLATGEYVADIDPSSYDMARAAKDPNLSRAAPPNPAGINRLPKYALVYKVMKDGALSLVVLPVHGKGLWSTLYGFLALDADLNTIHGITFYQHGETPGLGGEVDNPRWKSLWIGRKAFDEQGQPAIGLAKGPAGGVEDDPHRVDGLSGATLTSRGVTNLARFWLGQQGFGPYLEKLRNARSENG